MIIISMGPVIMSKEISLQRSSFVCRLLTEKVDPPSSMQPTLNIEVYDDIQISSSVRLVVTPSR